MKLYEQLFGELTTTLDNIKVIREEKRNLNVRFRELSTVHPNQYHHESEAEICDIMNALGSLHDDENLEFSFLIQYVDEAYYSQPFQHIREQGKNGFWRLANEYLDDILVLDSP